MKCYGTIPAKRSRLFSSTVSILCWLLVLTVSSQAQDFLNGYAFASGTNPGIWKTLTNPIDVGELDLDTTSNTRGHDMPIGFDLNFFGRRYDVISVNNRGISFVGPDYLTEESYSPPYVSAFSFGMYAHVNVKYQKFGSPGVRVLVFEFHSTEWMVDTSVDNTPDTLNYNNFYWQIQFSEVDDAITFVYRAADDTGSINNATFLGLCSGDGNIYLYPGNHTISADYFSTMPWMAWPGNYHYYTFTPLCPCSMPKDLHVRHLDETSAEVWWNPSTRQNRVLLEYGPEDFSPGQGTAITTSDSTVLLSGLAPGTVYDLRAQTVCQNRCTSEVAAITFKTYCENPDGNLYFANLHDENVSCRIGTFRNPSTEARVVDYGPDNIFSRHTVNLFRSTDPRTGYFLPLIPPNLCHSVRLGNWNSGGQQEDITYTIAVDSNEIELLVLRYAIVEQQPDHDSAQMPRFTFSVLDEEGDTIDACYNANFVAGIGENNEWHQGSGADIVWRNWSAVGIDLTALHGRTVNIRLSNFDCAPGAHFGYAYFTFEKALKTIRAANCGNSPVNTYYAPEGFNYRWYSADNPTVTLSTADSLHVTTAGVYYCRITFLGGGNECGFTLSTRSGARFPVADFSIDSLNDCGSALRFINRSVVANDADHTQLTSEPCEEYLWRVDGVEVSSERNLDQIFIDGDHTVTLVAMLGGGLCRDSISRTVSVSRPTVNIDTTICPNTGLHIAGQHIYDTGYFVINTECEHRFIHIHHYDTVITELFDTICKGMGVEFFGRTYYTWGTYPWILTDRHGCDSAILLTVSTFDYIPRTITDTLPPGSRYLFADTSFRVPGTYSVLHDDPVSCDTLFTFFLHCITNHDTTVCVADLPVTWHGKQYTEAGSDTLAYSVTSGVDSLVVYSLHVRERAKPQVSLEQSCNYPPHFIVTLTGRYRYLWEADPPCTPLDTTVLDTLYKLHVAPDDPTVIRFLSDYTDEPSCPGTDSVSLSPANYFHVMFEVVPKYLTPANLSFTAYDRSVSITSREWFIDSVLQAEQDAVLSAVAPFEADSVTVSLVGHLDACSDTATHVIPIHRHDIFFPNIFTPGQPGNNRFGAIGNGITEYELWVYDRRGVLVFHCTDLKELWDGTWQGHPCPQGTYTYRCRYTLLGTTTGPQNHAGTVLLLR